MSTRCQILIEGSDVVLYRHSDGYPQGPHGVLKLLKKSVATFVKHRGHDECYMPAHIMTDMIVAHKKSQDAMIRKAKKDGNPQYIASYEAGKYLGYGVEAYTANDEAASEDNTLHGDIEFLYVVKKNGTIEVRSCFIDHDGPSNIANTKLVKTVVAVKK